MTPDEHRAEAERLLDAVTVAPEDLPLADLMVMLTKAHVHATLAWSGPPAPAPQDAPLQVDEW